MNRPNLIKALDARIPIFINAKLEDSVELQILCFQRGIGWFKDGNELKPEVSKFYIRKTGDGQYCLNIDGAEAHQYAINADLFFVTVLVSDLPGFMSTLSPTPETPGEKPDLTIENDGGPKVEDSCRTNRRYSYYFPGTSTA